MSVEHVTVMRPSEFATDEAWAQASLDRAWEAEARVDAAQIALDDITAAMARFHNDLGDFDWKKRALNAERNAKRLTTRCRNLRARAQAAEDEAHMLRCAYEGG